MPDQLAGGEATRKNESSMSGDPCTPGDENGREFGGREEIGRTGYWCELGNETGWIGVRESPSGALGPSKKILA